MTETTVKAGEFEDLLTDLLRTAETDDTLPMLCGIRLHTGKFSDQTVLVGTSTDRFTLGQANIDATGHMDEIFLPIASCKRILAALKLANQPTFDTTLTLDREAARLTAAVADIVSVTVLVELDPEFPKMWRIYDAMDTREPAPGGTPVQFEPAFFSRFTAIAKSRRDRVLVSHSTPNAAAIITIGSRYRGACMPVRQPEGWVKAPWFVSQSELDAKARHEAEQVEAALKAKRSAAAKKAAATRAARKTTAKPTSTRKKAA